MILLRSHIQKSQRSRELRREAVINRRHILTHVWKHPHDNPDLMHKEAHVTVLRLEGWSGKTRDLVNIAKAVYEKRLQGKELTNMDTMEPVRFGSEGKTQGFGGMKHPIDAAVVTALGRIVRRAIQIDKASPDERRVNNTRHFHYFVAPLIVNDELLTVKLTIREALMSRKGDSNFKFYDVAVLKMPVRSIGLGVAGSQSPASSFSHELTGKISVADMVSVFKGDNERHIPKPATLKSIKPPPQNDKFKKSRIGHTMYLLKAHVRDYDRVSKTGAIEHIRAHEDNRVRSYGRKIAGSRDSYDLHQLRRDRFGHLPHWSKLDEHTRQAILDAEEEKAKGHKSFEEWKEKAHGKKKDAEKVDRSGWEQQLMFKGIRHGLYLIRKSQMTFDFSGSAHDHHVAYTRTNAAGTVSQIQAKGVQHKIDSYHPETQKIVLGTYNKLIQDFPHPNLPVTIGTTESKTALGESAFQFDEMSLTGRWNGLHPDSISGPVRERPEWVTAHEFGHAIDGILRYTTRDSASHDKYMRTISKIKAEHKKTGGVVSLYSLKNRDEWVAEHFADALINGDKAMPASKKLYQTMKELYASHPYKSHQQLRDAMRREREERQIAKSRRVQHVAYILRKSKADLTLAARVNINGQQIHRWVKVHAQPTEHELKAMEHYTGGGSQKLNPYLWSDRQSVEFHGDRLRQNEMPEEMVQGRKENLDERISHLNKLTQKHSLSIPVRLIRVARGESGSRYTEGDIITEKGFLSTSLDEEHDKKWTFNPADYAPDRGVKIVIHAPAGTRGFDVDSTGRGYNENEFLLPAGTRYRVIKKTETDNGVVVEAAIVPPIDILETTKLTHEMILPRCGTPNDIDEQKRYINIFLKEFGGDITTQVPFEDVSGAKLNMSARLFKNRKEKRYKVFDQKRERYLLMLADAIKDPTEIWEDTTIRKGKQTAIRRYIKVYEDKRGKVGGVAIFDFMGHKWEGTSVFQADTLRYVDNQRTGKLVYQKIKKSLAIAPDQVAALSIPFVKRTGARVTKLNISLPENKFNKSHNLYLIKATAAK